MAVSRDKVKSLLDKISESVKQSEADYKSMPIDSKLFRKTLALGHYTTILKNYETMSPEQQLQALHALYDVARQLAGSHDPKFTWTTLHAEIKDQLAEIFADEKKQDNTSSSNKSARMTPHN